MQIYPIIMTLANVSLPVYCNIALQSDLLKQFWYDGVGVHLSVDLISTD